MVRLSALLPCFFLCTLSFAQSNKAQPKKRLILSPGISYQKNMFAELNAMLIDEAATRGGPCEGGLAAGPRIGMEMNFVASNRIVAPKLGYELSGQLICVRANAVYYISKTNKDLRLLPELGFSLMGTVNLCYGYGFSVLKDKIKEVSHSRITLTVNLSKNLWQQL
jgi:hypothetical protein